MDKKEKKMAMLGAALAENPNLRVARAYIKRLGIILIAIRAVQVMLELYFAIQLGDYYTLAQNTVTTMVMILFLMGIYQGRAGFAYLPIVGSLISVSMAAPVIFALFGEGFIPFLYSVVFLVAAASQGLIMLLILTEPQCREYFQVVKEINQRI